jgi:hypothetical protein
MADMSELATPSLFDSTSSEIPLADIGSGSSEKLARDFVRWCFSFGETFRNSPDATNLKYWAKKAKLKIRESDEAGILSEARKLYQKRLIQSTTPSVN